MRVRPTDRGVMIKEHTTREGGQVLIPGTRTHYYTDIISTPHHHHPYLTIPYFN